MLQKTLQPLYYAREDTRRPFHYALVAMVVNAGIAIGLMPVIGFIAAALATTLAGWTMVLQLWLGTRGMGEAARADARLKRRIWRITLASALMGMVLWAASVALTPFLGTPSLRYVALAVLIGLGMLSYFGLGQLIGAFRLSDLRRAMRR